MASNEVSPHNSTSRNNNQKVMSSSASHSPNHVIGVDEKPTVTPEQDHHQYLTRTTALANAPYKRSFIPSPLIRTKVEKDDVGEDAEKIVVAKGSKSSAVKQVKPLTHTKITEKKTDQDPSSSNRDPTKLPNGSLNGTRTTTVKVSKGIEMKRTKKVAASTSAATEAKTQGVTVTKPDLGKAKPTRTTVVAHYVPTKPGPSQSQAAAVAQKKKAVDKLASKPPVPVADDNPKLENGQNGVFASATNPPSENKLPPPEPKSVEPAVTVKVNAMEPTKDKPVKYFKSKFSVDLRRKPESSARKPKKDLKDESRKKDLQTYIEKRRELRLMEQKKDEETKRQAEEKRKKQLVDLNQKCRGIVTSSAKQAQTMKTPPSCAFVLSDKQPMKQFRNKQSLSPMKARRNVPTKNQSPLVNGTATATPKNTDSIPTELTRKEGIDLRTSTLLREFENIVQKECMTILRSHQPSKSPSPKKQKPETPSKVDAAVETTISLFDERNEALSEVRKSSGRRATMYKSFIHDRRDGEDRQSVSMEVKNNSATRIQAAYKGYRIRKILKGLKESPGARKQGRLMKRDWPFTTGLGRRTQEKARKPSDARGSSNWEYPYIPPPEQNSFGLSNVKGMPVTSLSHIELSRFQEPFPKEAIRRLSVIHSSPRPKSFYERRYSDSVFKVPALASKGDLDLDVTDSPRPLEDVSIPRFSTVLKEKVRLLEEKTAMAIRVQEKKASPNRTRKSLRERQHPDGIQEETASEIPSERQTTTNTITEEYIGPDEKKMKQAYAPRTIPRSAEPKSPRRRSKHMVTRKKKLSLPSGSPTKSGSTTTVETDVDLQSELQVEDSNSRQDENLPGESTSRDGVLPSSSLDMDKYPTPAMQLQFQAEKERLHILGEALKTTLAAEARNLEEGRESRKKFEAQKPEEDLESSVTKLNNNSSLNLNGSHDYMIQLAKCQADCLKATAEVTKWMTELRKAEMEREIVQRDQQTVNMATAVFAAVEEAKRLSGINSTTFIPEKKEEILQQQREKADEFTQFPSERSEVLQDVGLEVELTPTKLDSSSATSEAVTFMTEKSTIDYTKPDFVVEGDAQAQDNLQNVTYETYGEEEFEEPEESKSNRSLMLSEELDMDVDIASEKPSAQSVAESEHEHELQEEESLRQLIFSTSQKTRDDLKDFEEEIRRITTSLAHESTTLPPDANYERNVTFDGAQTFATEDSTSSLELVGDAGADVEPIMPVQSPKRDRIEKQIELEVESEVPLPEIPDQQSLVTGVVSEADSILIEPEQAEETEPEIEEISVARITSESSDSENENEQEDLKVPDEDNEVNDTQENAKFWQFIQAQINRSEESEEPSVAVAPNEPDLTAGQLKEAGPISPTDRQDDELLHVKNSTIPEDQQKAEIVELESSETKLDRVSEPHVQEPESPVPVAPEEDTEDSFLIEEVKTASSDTSFEEPERAQKPHKFLKIEDEDLEENDNGVILSQTEPEATYRQPEDATKPPPPYSGPVSKPIRVVEEVNNTCKDWQVRDMIQQHVDYIWNSWVTSKKFPPEYEQFSSSLPSDPEGRRQKDDNVYEQLISDTICEIIQEVLDVAVYPSLEKSYEDQVRLGPLAMKAQKFKLPQTKEKLLQQVYEEVLGLIPPGAVIFTNGASPQPEKRCTKWSCRQRDLPDEVLAQELVKEDRTWLNCWPEEVIVQNRLAESLIKRLISQVVQSFEVALN